MSTLRTIGSGALEFIASSGAISDAANVSFTQFNSSIYDHYAFFFQSVIPATDNVHLYVRTSTDGGSNYDATNGNYQVGGGNRTGLEVAYYVGSDSNEFGVGGIFYIYAPHLATYTYADHANIVYTYGNGTAYSANAAAGNGVVRKVADDVDAVQILFSSGNIESGEITMFGITNS